MSILNTHSLIATVDAFNDAILRQRPWEDEAEALIAWLSDRLGKAGGYAGSFALTAGDWDREFRLVTGERITTRAARAHIIAEETMRVLAIIHRVTGLACPALRRSEELLADRIFDHERSTAARDGMYCCGGCSVALWKCMAAGGYRSSRLLIQQGLASLARYRDGRGGWRRFPFYYTLSVLAEIGPSRAAAEIDYCSPRFPGLSRRLAKSKDRYSWRRLHFIQQLAPGSVQVIGK